MSTYLKNLVVNWTTEFLTELNFDLTRQKSEVFTVSKNAKEANISV